MKLASVLAVVLAVTACSKETRDAPAAPAAPAAVTPGAAAPAPASVINAIVGKPAPAFALKDLEGHEVSLAAFRGKPVVLEWFNPQCPFVKKSHGVGSLVGTAKRHTDAGVVWLAINSGGPGKQGNDLQVNKDAVKTWSLAHPVLRDEDGAVGKAYGATNTPHMFVIDAAGTVVYAGAIDNSPDAEGQSAPGGKLVNHVDAALAALAAGTPIEIADTKAYGCSVKYGS